MEMMTMGSSATGHESKIVRETVRGVKGLAERLGVHKCTVQKWRNMGVLDKATIADYGRIIIFDFDKVCECLKHHSSKPGRPRTR